MPHSFGTAKRFQSKCAELTDVGRLPANLAESFQIHGDILASSQLEFQRGKP